MLHAICHADQFVCLATRRVCGTHGGEVRVKDEGKRLGYLGIET